MYPEFIAIYIGLGVLFIIEIVTLILMIILLSRSKKNGTGIIKDSSANRPSSDMGIAFCVNCGTQFDGRLNVCPKCGKTRR